MKLIRLCTAVVDTRHTGASWRKREKWPDIDLVQSAVGASLAVACQPGTVIPAFSSLQWTHLLDNYLSTQSWSSFWCVCQLVIYLYKIRFMTMNAKKWTTSPSGYGGIGISPPVSAHVVWGIASPAFHIHGMQTSVEHWHHPMVEFPFPFTAHPKKKKSHTTHEKRQLSSFCLQKGDCTHPSHMRLGGHKYPDPVWDDP